MRRADPSPPLPSRPSLIFFSFFFPPSARWLRGRCYCAVPRVPRPGSPFPSSGLRVFSSFVHSFSAPLRYTLAGPVHSYLASAPLGYVVPRLAPLHNATDCPIHSSLDPKVHSSCPRVAPLSCYYPNASLRHIFFISRPLVTLLQNHHTHYHVFFYLLKLIVQSHSISLFIVYLFVFARRYNYFSPAVFLFTHDTSLVIFHTSFLTLIFPLI